MDARRVRILVGSICSAGMLMSLLVTPAAAACALSAPDSVDIGSPLNIQGSGFPASTTVDVSITIEGGSPDEFTVQSDASGGFAIGLTPEAADTGITTVVASAGADCTAQTVIAVGVDVVAETPEPTAEAEGVGAAPPRSDGEDLGQDRAPGASTLPWLMGGLMFLLGIGGVYATRPARKR